LDGLIVACVRHPPRATRRDFPDQLLQIPAFFTKTHRQRIEQGCGLRIGCLFAELAKVVGCGHQAAAKKVVPYPVDNDARRERIGGIEHAVG